MKTGLLIDLSDNVAVVASNVEKGEEIRAGDEIIVAGQQIPVGHKVAVKDINKNEYVYKYGVPIGLTNTEIHKGDYVHTHNIIDITEDLCKSYIEEFMKGVIKNG